MATAKKTTYEQAMRAMRRFQDEYARSKNVIISIQTYSGGADSDCYSIELVASVWKIIPEMQQRTVKWYSWGDSAETFKERFAKFRKEFQETFIQGQPVVINY